MTDVPNEIIFLSTGSLRVASFVHCPPLPLPYTHTHTHTIHIPLIVYLYLEGILNWLISLGDSLPFSPAYKAIIYGRLIMDQVRHKGFKDIFLKTMPNFSDIMLIL